MNRTISETNAVKLKSEPLASSTPAPKKRPVRFGDLLFKWSLLSISGLVILLMVLMMAGVFEEALPAFKHFGAHFFYKTNWDPVANDYGALTFIFGTLVTSFLALVIATPVSVATAVFLTELAPPGISKVMGFLVEMLAAIPSIVYGLWGIFFLAPWLRAVGQPFLSETLGFLPLFQGAPYGVGILAAGLILAIMITPTISSICREVFRSVPLGLREASLALGSTRWEMIRISVLKTGKSGIMGAVILGLGRALGETMAVTMVIGNRPEISWSLFSPAQTMASVIANEYAEASGGLYLSALSAIGFGLFLVSLLVNAVAKFLVMRTKRESGL